MAKSEKQTEAFSPKIKKYELKLVLSGLETIGNLEIEDFDLNRAIVKNIKVLKEQFEAYEKTINSIKRKYVKVDDNGNFETTDDKQFYKFKSTDDSTKHFNEVESLNVSYVDLKEEVIQPIKMSSLKKIKSFEEKDKDGNSVKRNVLTASMIAALGDLVQDDLD